MFFLVLPRFNIGVSYVPNMLLYMTITFKMHSKNNFKWCSFRDLLDIYFNDLKYVLSLFFKSELYVQHWARTCDPQDQKSHVSLTQPASHSSLSFPTPHISLLLILLNSYFSGNQIRQTLLYKLQCRYNNNDNITQSMRKVRKKMWPQIHLLPRLW